MMSQYKILLIEDDASIRENFKEILECEGYDTQAVENAIEALLVINQWNPDLIVCDQQLPGMNGEELFHELNKPNRNRFIFFTATNANREMLVRLQKLATVIVKPVGMDEFLQIVKNSLSTQ